MQLGAVEQLDHVAALKLHITSSAAERMKLRTGTPGGGSPIKDLVALMLIFHILRQARTRASRAKYHVAPT
jgi:hypothetical protein